MESLSRPRAWTVNSARGICRMVQRLDWEKAALPWTGERLSSRRMVNSSLWRQKIGVWLYDVAKSRPLVLLPAEKQITSLSFSPDGSTLAWSERYYFQDNNQAMGRSDRRTDHDYFRIW